MDRDRPSEGEDHLESPSVAWSRSRVVSTAAVVVLAAALAVVGAVVGHPRTHAKATPVPPPPLPTTLPARSVHYSGAVFLEPLDQCVRTDHRQTLRLAVEVTNLTNSRLRIINAALVSSVPDVRLARLAYWSRPCGGVITGRALALAPAGHLVVAMTLALGSTCPATSLLGARLTFDIAGTQVQAESSALANLAKVHFVQCPG